ncbi:SH3 and multiple ankyrin repeat domains protein 2-like isoform X3 [Symsagittifera roscoffensis]|uniref:SH3 and multiple ankyrin repeat domains protein 2-like isoform X3 n=1 Tax=Symsagittifera roscoffensis TaxID=84072 RepID=UPI00307BCD4D
MGKTDGKPTKRIIKRTAPNRRVSVQKKTKTNVTFSPKTTGHCEVIVRSPPQEKNEEKSDKDDLPPSVQTKVVKMQRRPSVVLRGVPSELKQEGEEGRVRLFQELPGTYYRVHKSYHPSLASNLQTDLPLEKGTLVEVLYVGDHGMLEGRVRDKIGWFPSSHVEMPDSKGTIKGGSYRSGGLFGRNKGARREGFPREVKLKKQTKRGYGFVIRGAMANVPNFIPTPEFPALQYFDSVDKGGAAEKAGLRPGDFILEFNGEDVRGITHSHLVERIKQSNEGFTIKVMTPFRNSSAMLNPNASLSSKRLLIGAPQPPQRNPNTSLSLNRIKSPSLDQLPPHREASDEDATPVNTAGRQKQANNPPSSLQNLFQVSSSPNSSTRTTNISQSGTQDSLRPKLFQSARDSPRNAKKLPSSQMYSHSALDIREVSESTESVNTNSENSSERTKFSTNESTTALSSSSASTLSLAVPSSRNSCLIEDDEELQIAANGSQTVYANISYHNQNNHKPVIKSKSKDSSNNAANPAINSSLKSTFYNLSKSKKPAPPPPPKRKPQEKGYLDNNLDSSTEFSTTDLNTNLRMSEIALNQHSENSISTSAIPVIANGSSSFKPKKSTQLQLLNTNKEISLETENSSQLSQNVQTQEISVTIASSSSTQMSSEPEQPSPSEGFKLPSPDYSDSENESGADDNTSTTSTIPEISESVYNNTDNNPHQFGSGLKNRESELQMMQDARNQPLAQLEDDDDEDSDSEFNEDKHVRLTKYSQKVEKLNLPSGDSDEDSYTKHTYRVSTVPESAKSKSGSVSNVEDFALCSPSSVIVTETQTIQYKQPEQPVSLFQGDLLAAINKRKSQVVDNDNVENPATSIDKRVQKQSEENSVQYKPGASTVNLRLHREPVYGDSFKTTSQIERENSETFAYTPAAPQDSSTSSSADAETSQTRISSGSLDYCRQNDVDDDADVDALISQFYVPPPPEKLLEDSQGPSLANSTNQNSLHDQGYESASASPDSTRSERQPPVSTFLKQRHNHHLMNITSVNTTTTSTNSSHLAIVPPKTSYINTNSISGQGDRPLSASRTGLNEILSEYENRSKSTTPTNTPTLPNGSMSSEVSTKSVVETGRSPTAKEVLSRSNYPKSDRLLQLINQSVTPSKPSYLNTFGQQNNVGALPPKPLLQPKAGPTPPSSAPIPTDTSDLRNPSQNAQKPLSSESDFNISSPNTAVTSSSLGVASHTYPRFDITSREKPDQPLVSTPRFNLNYSGTSGRPFSYSSVQTNSANPISAPNLTNHISSPKPVVAAKPNVSTNKNANLTNGASGNVASMAIDMQPVEQWSVETVCEWLRSIKMSDYEDKFKSNDIVGSHLKMLSKEDLAELGVTSLGHRLTIEKAIKQL